MIQSSRNRTRRLALGPLGQEKYNCDEHIGCAFYYQRIRPNYHFAKYNQGASMLYAKV